MDTVKPCIFTRHAQERMIERKITPHQVESVLAAPSKSGPAKNGLKKAEGIFPDERILKVVYYDLGTTYRIITVCWKD